MGDPQAMLGYNFPTSVQPRLQCKQRIEHRLVVGMWKFSRLISRRPSGPLPLAVVLEVLESTATALSAFGVAHPSAANLMAQLRLRQAAFQALIPPHRAMPVEPAMQPLAALECPHWQAGACTHLPPAMLDCLWT